MWDETGLNCMATMIKAPQRDLHDYIDEDDRHALCLMFNAGLDAVDFSLPAVPWGVQWHLAADTSPEPPQDLFAAGEELIWEDRQTYHLGPRSSAVLLARGPTGQQSQTALEQPK